MRGVRAVARRRIWRRDGEGRSNYIPLRRFSSMAYKAFVSAADLEHYFDTATQRAIFLELAYRADRKGVVRMPQSELAEITLWSLATIKREMGRLREIGLVEQLGHGRYGLVFQPDNHAEVPPKKETKQEGQAKVCVSCGEPIDYAVLRVYYTRQGQEQAYHYLCDPNERGE